MKKQALGIYLIIIAISTLLFNSCQDASTQRNDSKQKQAKYIFYFIGDGMGHNHVSLAEAYLMSTQNPSEAIGFEHLCMTEFPNLGQAETHCKDQLITDSGAAGSALACGEKFNFGTISYRAEAPESERDAVSIAEIAKEKGLKVGIITTVSLNHATPAVFYASEIHRSHYGNIAQQLFDSNFDFFGGGDITYSRKIEGDKAKVDALKEKNKNQIYNSLSDLFGADKSQKAIFINSALSEEESMPYAIDRDVLGGNALCQIVETAIEYLDNENGFFMMVEGGKIDWAAHANDAATLAQEVIDFDDAIKIAYDFYLKHPDETMIVITADHETGGANIGKELSKYKSKISSLGKQKASTEYFTKIVEEYKISNPQTYKINDIIALANEHFYTNFSLNPDQINRLKNACEAYYNPSNIESDESYILYGSYNPIVASLAGFTNEEAGVGFTTWSHTASRVPVYSIGEGTEILSGTYDNTEIPQKMLKLLNWEIKK